MPWQWEALGESYDDSGKRKLVTFVDMEGDVDDVQDELRVALRRTGRVGWTKVTTDDPRVAVFYIDGHSAGLEVDELGRLIVQCFGPTHLASNADNAASIRHFDKKKNKSSIRPTRVKS